MRFLPLDSSLGLAAAHHVSGVHGGDLRQRKALVLAKGERRLAVQPLKAPLRVQVFDLMACTQGVSTALCQWRPSRSCSKTVCGRQQSQTVQHPRTADSNALSGISNRHSVCDSCLQSSVHGAQYLGSREAQLVQRWHGVGQPREVPQLAQQNLQASMKVQINTLFEDAGCFQMLGGAMDGDPSKHVGS